MKPDAPLLGVIGGTGLNQLPGLQPMREHQVDTPYGACSCPVIEGEIDGQRVFFLARHGVPHRIPPHRINYRANLWALHSLGVRELVAVNAVGGLREEMEPGHLVFPDQVIDYTWGREHTLYDGSDGELEHIDFTTPYHPALRERLLHAAAAVPGDCRFFPAGTYAATQGPRLESAAEVRKLRQDGCDVVGMTGMPEAALAAELGLDYACICMVVNPAAGLSDEPITMEAMQAVLQRDANLVSEILLGLIRQTAETRSATPG